MVYLDNAATTYPKPKAVMQSVVEAMTTYGGNPGRSGHAMSLRTSEQIYQIRESLGRFFGVDSLQVIFTSNCSQSLNMAIKGILSSGGHAITTSYEHNSVIRPLYSLAQKKIASYDIATILPHDISKTLQNLEALLKSDTKLIVCTHASNVNGVIMPIREIGAFCKQHGIIFVVDAAQTAGILPIDLVEMQIDILCVAGHKGLYGVPGSGLMVFGNFSLQLDTLVEGGTGSLSERIEQPEFLPDRFETGTLNTLGIMSMGAGLSYIQNMGLQKIYTHEFLLCQEIYQELSKMKQIETYVNFYESGHYVPVVLFNVRGKPWSKVVTQMSEKGYALRGGYHCAFLAHQTIGTIDCGAVRVSPSVFTTKKEIHGFLQALKQL